MAFGAVASGILRVVDFDETLTLGLLFVLLVFDLASSLLEIDVEEKAPLPDVVNKNAQDHAEPNVGETLLRGEGFEEEAQRLANQKERDNEVFESGGVLADCSRDRRDKGLDTV